MSHILYVPLVLAVGVVIGLWIARITRRNDD